MYAEAEPYYAFAARNLVNEAPDNPALPRCLIFLAYTEAFLGKEKLAGEYWKQSLNYAARTNGLPFTPKCKVSVKISKGNIKISLPSEGMPNALVRFCRDHPAETANFFPGSGGR
jgi:hypothetical protein